MNHGQKFVTLSDSLLIGSGTERDCYQHPDDPNLCIKVNNGKVLKNKKTAAKQNLVEFRYYRRFQKKAKHWTVIPLCHGWTDTNQGPGLVFDLVRNDDGSISLPLIRAIDQQQITADEASLLLLELKRFMMQELVIPNDLHPDNILVQWRSGTPRLMLIDGIGSRDLIKLAERIKFLGTLKIQRNWNRLLTRLTSLRPDYFAEKNLR